MKKVIGLFILISLILGCKKENGGNMLFKMQYTTSTNGLKATSDPIILHSGFGDYITSLTPHHFSGKFQMLFFQDGYNLMDGNTHAISFMDGNMDPNDPSRIADFSNNAVVSFSPDLRGIQDDHGLFTGETINFIYFYFDVRYFYQQVALPPEYDTVTIAMFNRSYGNGNSKYYSDSVKVNNVLSIDYFPFISKVLNDDNYWPTVYLFGNCDSTFIFNKEKNWIQTSENNLLVGSTNQPIFRSNNYDVVSITTPTDGETVEMVATLGFDTHNLIQIYAGADNIPYTADDIFTYAPRFWERLKASLTIKQ